VAGSAREQAALLPLAPGVYRFRDAAGKVLYLGRATTLRRRVTSYWGDLGGRAHLGRMVARVARVEAVACDSVHEAAWLERNLLLARKPPWNRAPAGGAEVEVWIRLSDDARSPGVAVVHLPSPAAPSDGAPDARHFGPYLGGRQVRLAVSGLCRVLPLNYAGAELTGTRHDMARIRGITEGAARPWRRRRQRSSAATRPPSPRCGNASSSAATPPLASSRSSWRASFSRRSRPLTG
jgi:excinuclease ABC subunit C